MTQADEFVTQGEAARRFGVSAPTLRKRVRAGEIAAYERPLDGRALLVRVADVEALLEPRPVRQPSVENAAPAA